MTFDYCDSPDKLCTPRQELVKPLTEEKILKYQDLVPFSLGSDLVEFVRAIEKEHGIV